MAPKRVTHGSSRRVKPRRHERVLSDAAAFPERTILPRDFVGDGRPVRLQVVTTDQALYVRADRRATRLPWTEVAAFDHVTDTFADFVIGELRNGESFRICVSCGGHIAGPPVQDLRAHSTRR